MAVYHHRAVLLDINEFCDRDAIQDLVEMCFEISCEIMLTSGRRLRYEKFPMRGFEKKAVF